MFSHLCFHSVIHRLSHTVMPPYPFPRRIRTRVPGGLIGIEEYHTDIPAD